MRAYFAYLEELNGVIKSQVVNVILFLNEIKVNTTLLFFVNFKNYFAIRKELKKYESLEFILVPTYHNFKWNTFLLRLLKQNYKIKTIVYRGVNSAKIVNKINFDEKIYDGRGAFYAETTEYFDKDKGNLAYELEKNAVFKSDKNIAVSNKLVEYWRNTFGYENNNYFVIPTLINFSNVETNYLRETNKIRIVFVGSSFDWQSIDKVIQFARFILSKNEYVHFVFLTKTTTNLENLKNDYKDRVEINFVDKSKVNGILDSCDYGILIREDSITNTVSAPTKFAEYLSSGLKVIISNNIGDFSQFAIKNDLGIDYNSILNGNISLEKISDDEKKRVKDVAFLYFSRYSYVNQMKYRSLFFK